MFFSSLKNCEITDEEYQRACDVWKVFEIKNLGEYHDLYLKIDILLCDIFEKFISACLKDYRLDPCKRSDDKTIMYWDMNNLYGTVMSFDYLPYGDFKFLSEAEIKVFDLYSVPQNSLFGYLEYPTFLHDLHNDYPLCPEKIEVGYDMLSNYSKEIVDWYGIKVGGVKKLIPNLSDKVKHVDHYKNL